ncbi:uncharacterized protein J5F26_013927 [Ciconia maguari]
MSGHNSSAMFALDTWNRKEQHSSSAMCNIPKKHHGNISVLLPSRSAIRSLQRFDRGAVTSETILLQQALQKSQKSQPYIQQSGRRLKRQREAWWLRYETSRRESLTYGEKAVSPQVGALPAAAGCLLEPLPGSCQPPLQVPAFR